MPGITIEEGITIEGGISIVIDDGTPQNVIPPVISVVTTPPNVRVGKTLLSTTGTWNSSFPILGYYYQWNNNGIPISGATSSTYIVQSTDLSDYITCTVRGYSSYGPGVASVSNSLGPVLPSNIPAIGDFIYGGYYAGTVVVPSLGSQFLIVAPASTEIQGDYYNAYAHCTGLTTGGYSDWELPAYGFYPVMDTASTNPLWPAGQAYYTIPDSGRINYWVRTIPNPSPSSLISIYRFWNGTYELNYPTYTTFSGRATRLQAIPS